MRKCYRALADGFGKFPSCLNNIVNQQEEAEADDSDVEKEFNKTIN
jgi:hypothetical protein